MTRKIFFRLALLALFVPLAAFPAKTKKAVFVIVDGIPADMIERLAPPAIYEIAARGAYARAYCGGTVGRYDQTPTISAVGYASALTATWANKHNVWDNSPQPNYNYWTIFRIAKAQKKPVRTAIYSSWTDNRTVLLGEGRPETANLKMDYAVDGLDLDEKNYPKEKDDLHIFRIDEAISEAAAEGIRNDAPDLSWVYLWYTDDAGHIYGNSDYFDEYTMKADRQIARIWEAVRYRETHFDEEWMIVVTTDHGRGPDGHHHGGQSERERTTWISTNVEPNAHFAAPLLSITDINPSICRFMGFEVPRDVRWEQDGMPFIGRADIEDLTAERRGDTIELNWTSLDDKAPATIYVATTNDFREGGTDRWTKAGKVKAGAGAFTFDASAAPDGFYKFVVVTPNNHLCCWSPAK